MYYILMRFTGLTGHIIGSCSGVALVPQPLLAPAVVVLLALHLLFHSFVSNFPHSTLLSLSKESQVCAWWEYFIQAYLQNK